jgi:hypothetical protein
VQRLHAAYEQRVTSWRGIHKRLLAQNQRPHLSYTSRLTAHAVQRSAARTGAEADTNQCEIELLHRFANPNFSRDFANDEYCIEVQRLTGVGRRRIRRSGRRRRRLRLWCRWCGARKLRKTRIKRTRRIERDRRNADCNRCGGSKRRRRRCWRLRRQRRKRRILSGWLGWRVRRCAGHLLSGLWFAQRCYHF